MSQAENRVVRQNLAIRGIEILNTSSNFLKINNNATFKFDITLQFQVDHPNKVIYVLVSIEVKDEETKEKIGLVDVGCNFGITNFDEEIKADSSGKYHIPDYLNKNITSIAIATVRGIMFATFKGTFLHNAILPVTDVEISPAVAAVE